MKSGKLFESDSMKTLNATAPLAERMRPRTFDEFVGQETVVGVGRPLREAIERDTLQSIILWGPPGTGKTTLARLIATITKAHFIAFSAVLSGIKEIKSVMTEAKDTRRLLGRRTILFIDEIHRFNKAQQDAFLPRVEAGDIVLIGATTENPSFEVNAALLSRSIVLF
jgi:putative ATPase